MKLKTTIFTAFLAWISVCALQSCGESYVYETVPNDPLNARIYTLDNGLKVYMTVNKDAPRIQTYMAVHVGSKNDPAETTGLAHYFEHLMFKGTQQFGTQNYELEKPLLDAIEQQFEVYRNTTDPLQRKAIYHVIDSLSLEASKIAIPNEYDKLMAGIGAYGTNAWTDYDETVYTEEIPSNQIENWAKIQADRFANNVIRGFHTELETVYEEMNMYSIMDDEKVSNQIMASLFPSHPYGQQTVIGKQEHLKNPSITNIKKYHDQFYVPNNMAICLSGDFVPEEMIAVIDKYFGSWAPNPSLPSPRKVEEAPITAPIVKEVWGPEAERMAIAWRGPHILDSEDGLFNVFSQILFNGKCGIIDTDLLQTQKVLSAYAYSSFLADGSMFMMMANPKEGQTLDQTRELLLASLDKVRKGDFDEEFLKGVVKNAKLAQMRQLERNGSRAQQFVSAFINNMSWEYAVGAMARMEAVTKEDLVAFANKYFSEDNCVVIYKKQGPDRDYVKIEKPAITPIYTNRDTSSAFLMEVLAAQVKPIEPVFYDLEKDVRKVAVADGAQLMYVPNTTNQTFQLTINYPIGSKNDNLLPIAGTYWRYLGTDSKSADEIKTAFYDLACSFGLSCNITASQLNLSGLSEDFLPALELLKDYLLNAKADDQVYKMMVGDLIKERMDAKAEQSANAQRLQYYMMYGPVNPTTNIPSVQTLLSTSPQVMLEKMKVLLSTGFDAYYYGPDTAENVSEMLRKTFASNPLNVVEELEPYAYLPTTENIVYLAQFDANQMAYSTISYRPEDTFDKVPFTAASLYNNYFGSSMNAIVFQEMREARGLAYSARARLAQPQTEGLAYSFTSSIATQNDKMADAMSAFDEIINDMPQSQRSFDLAKEGMLATIRTQRYAGRNLLNTYMVAKSTGVWNDMRSVLFNELPNMTMEDLVKFQQEWIKGRTTSYSILSDIKALDLNELAKYGTIRRLSQEELFGY